MAITIFLVNQQKIILANAQKVLESQVAPGYPGVALLDGAGEVIAKFKAADLAGWVIESTNQMR